MTAKTGLFTVAAAAAIITFAAGGQSHRARPVLPVQRARLIRSK